MILRKADRDVDPLTPQQIVEDARKVMERRLKTFLLLLTGFVVGGFFDMWWSNHIVVQATARATADQAQFVQVKLAIENDKAAAEQREGELRKLLNDTVLTWQKSSRWLFMRPELTIPLESITPEALEKQLTYQGKPGPVYAARWVLKN